MGVENRNPPEQLPIVLQVHTHTHRATFFPGGSVELGYAVMRLEGSGRFLEGSWRSGAPFLTQQQAFDQHFLMVRRRTSSAATVKQGGLKAETVAQSC